MLRSVSAAVLLLVALVAAGCGGAPTATSSSGQTAAERDAARLKFTRCMREHGIDLPDNPGRAGGRAAFEDVDRTKLEAAMEACEKYREAATPELTAAQRQEFEDAFVKFAACMREHGVDVPTPGERGSGPVRISRDDPGVQAAMEACEDLRPEGPGGGVGPGGPGGPPAGGGGQN